MLILLAGFTFSVYWSTYSALEAHRCIRYIALVPQHPRVLLT